MEPGVSQTLAMCTIGRRIFLVSNKLKVTCDFPQPDGPAQLPWPGLLSEQSSPKFLPLTTGPAPGETGITAAVGRGADGLRERGGLPVL